MCKAMVAAICRKAKTGFEHKIFRTGPCGGTIADHGCANKVLLYSLFEWQKFIYPSAYSHEKNEGLNGKGRILQLAAVQQSLQRLHNSLAFAKCIQVTVVM